MPGTPDLEIAIPTHNCARWLDDLVESILKQETDLRWRLVVRDDASTDGTPSRIEHWRARLGERLIVVADSGQRNLGMIGNYDAVLAATSAPWVMFADPDDVWLPGKISLSATAMRQAESRFGVSSPIVVCSDAKVVDQGLQEIAGSYWRWSRMRPEWATTFHRLLMENPVLTSTMLVNRAVLDLALPMTGAASCPDWWPALVACAFGKIVLLDEKTVLYRRHPSNDSLTPLSETVAGLFRSVVKRPAEPKKRVQRLVSQLAPQANAFANRHGTKLPPGDKAALAAAGALLRDGALQRRYNLFAHHLWFASPVKNTGLLLLI